MNIDMSALRALEREKDISFELVCEAIETALLTAYHHTEGSAPHARVELDRKTGTVTVWAAGAAADERRRDAAGVRRHAGRLRPDRRDDRPAGHPAAAARRRARADLRRVRRPRGRHRHRRHPAARQHDRASDRPTVLVDLGKVEAIAAAGGAGARASTTSTASGSSATSSRCTRASAARRSRCRRTHPNLVRKLFALEVPEIADGSVEIVVVAREAGHRTKIAVRSPVPGVDAKGACIGPMGPRVRDVVAELHGEKIDIVDWSDDPATLVGNALSPANVTSRRGRRRRGPVGPGRRAGLPAVAGDRQGGPERPPRRPADRLADRHPQRRRPERHRRSTRSTSTRPPPRARPSRERRGRLQPASSRGPGPHLRGLSDPSAGVRPAPRRGDRGSL